MNKIYLTGLFFCFSLTAFSQFHTLTIPQASPRVIETQMLGITKITVEYATPSLRERDVWNDPNIIPQNGEPIPWRAGANMNTTIEFSTDVTVEGKPLQKGKYGFHIIPSGETFELLFAHANDQWGSYYLDKEKDVSLSVTVQAVSCPKSEQLEFEFLERSENTLTIGLEWGEKRIPFKVEVDLNKTVVESFERELRGINTYRWEAWNDAARWCLNHDTNLEEALKWANRSINGGYTGFAANKNLNNLTTKARLLKKLERKEELSETIEEASQIHFTAYEANSFIIFLLNTEMYQEGLTFSEKALEMHPGTWYLILNKGISLYFNDKKEKALSAIKESIDKGPPAFTERLKQVYNEVEAGTYKI